MSDAYNEGVQDFEDGVAYEDNGYEKGTEEYDDWTDGWLDAEGASYEKPEYDTHWQTTWSGYYHDYENTDIGDYLE
jgi:hypothetical protein